MGHFLFQQTRSRLQNNKVRKVAANPSAPARPKTFVVFVPGVYTATDIKRNGRIVYKQDFGGKSYIFYWDWGPNNGANWVVGHNPGK